MATLPFEGTVYLSNIQTIPLSAWEAAQQALPPERQAGLARLARSERRACSVAADCLLAAALRRFSQNGGFSAGLKQLPPSELTRLSDLQPFLPYTAYTGGDGKPYADGIAIGGQILFANLSHSGPWVAAGVSLSPIGVDVQRCGDTSPERCLKIFHRFRHPEEQPSWFQPEGDELSIAGFAGFASWWALKESVVKLTGEGLARSFTSFALRPISKLESYVEYSTKIDHRSIRCFLLPQPAPDTAVAVAVYDDRS